VLLCAVASAQEAPPEVDAALRARVDQFYQAHISGKLRDALPLIADESLNWFIGSSKQTYKSCKIATIEYSESFTKAIVNDSCEGEYRVHGHSMNVMFPVGSRWKVVDGQWFWYRVRETEIRTPFGISKIPPDIDPDTSDSSKPIIPGNPMAMAQAILQSVKTDKSEIKLDAGKVNEESVEVSNGMPGPISISVDKINQAGLSAKIEKSELKGGEKSRVIFRYNPNDLALQCGDCAKHVNGTVTAQVRVEPTGQVLPVSVTIAPTQPSGK
jgi:hypothetical protein